MYRRAMTPVLMAIVIGMASACANASVSSSGGGGAGTDTLVIGAPLGITGSAAAEGVLTKNGYDLWAEAVNQAGGIKAGGKTYKVEIKYYDDGSDAQRSAQLTDRLITQDGVKLLLGPYGTAATNQDAPIAEKNQVVMVEGNGAAESIFSHGYKYTFGVLSPAKKYAAVMVEMAAGQNPKPASVAILSANDAFSVEVADGAQDIANQQGISVAAYEKYPANATDLSNEVTIAKNSGAEMLLNSGHLAESLAIMKAAKELDYSPKLFAFTVGPTTPDFIQGLGRDAEDVVASSQWTDTAKYEGVDIFKTPKNYNDLYTKRFGSAPDYHAADGTAAGVALQLAIEKAGSIDPSAVRNALANLDAMTFYGQIKFDERGLNVYKPMVVQQIQDGKLKTVWPSDIAEASVRYPTPSWGQR
ncbi:MAG TPA: amino acid ABC transporter substrate-binding protein [Chloroflexota bacterium]|nr:amino acid ABC transporter substrate-binding protein [Chloroflexota bacterium]